VAGRPPGRRPRSSPIMGSRPLTDRPALGRMKTLAPSPYDRGRALAPRRSLGLDDPSRHGGRA
jgi:hypothetical protein